MQRIIPQKMIPPEDRLNCICKLVFVILSNIIKKRYSILNENPECQLSCFLKTVKSTVKQC